MLFLAAGAISLAACGGGKDSKDSKDNNSGGSKKDSLQVDENNPSSNGVSSDDSTKKVDMNSGTNQNSDGNQMLNGTDGKGGMPSGMDAEEMMKKAKDAMPEGFEMPEK